jgi:hypothetical protein
VLASGGRTLVWTAGLFLNVWNDSAYPPISESPKYPAGVLFESASNATLAYDRSGRLWLAWYGLPVSPAATGVFLEQLNPATGAPESGATPQRAPDSTNEVNAQTIRLACNAICHVIYQPGSARNELVSWAPGQAAPVTVIDITTQHAFMSVLGAAAAPDGRLWIAYLYADSASEQIIARLGDDNGVGGTATILSPPTAESLIYGGTLLDTPKGLVLAVNFAPSVKDTTNAVWGTVLPQP